MTLQGTYKLIVLCKYLFYPLLIFLLTLYDLGFLVAVIANYCFSGVLKDAAGSL